VVILDIMLKNIVYLIESKYKNDIDFEKDFGIARSTVSAWRKGKLKSYKKMSNEIATFFDVSLDWLAGTEQKNKPTAERSELINKILTICDGLPEDKQTELLEYAKYLVAKDK